MNLTWGYDGNGNRLSETQGTEAKTYGYTPETNRLAQVGKKTVTLDAAGNTLTDQGGKRRYVYNQAGRLAGFLKEKQLKASYTYDYRGLRTRKIKDPEKESKTIVFHYDQAGRLIAETDARGHPVRAYIYLEGTPIAQIEFGKHQKNDRVYYLHTDALGTPRLASDSGQRIAWRDNTNAFGDKIEDEGKDAGKKSKDAKAKESKEPKERENEDNEIKVNLRFPGQYYDAESGLHYNWNRYYDPKIGRYVTSDPIGLRGGQNTFLYVRSNPLKFIDPFGLAYFAKRPLRGSPWIPFYSCNPIYEFFDVEISHEQLFFEDGKNPENIGFFDDGTLKTEPDPTGYRCRSGKYNDCIMRKAVANTPALPSYCIVGPNCQKWAARVHEEYRRLEKDPQVQKECEECKK